MWKTISEIFGYSDGRLLTESVSVNDIDDAMDGHKRILMSYRTKGEDKNTGPRVIEVYAYGLTKAGNPVIRAFQPYGDTTSKVPSWKFFRLDRIISWKDTGQIFDRPASDYYKGLGNFNPNGDNTMSVVYKIISFNGHELDAPLAQPVTKDGKPEAPTYKTDTEKRMARLRNQLNNPITLSDLRPSKQTAPTPPSTTVDSPTPQPKPTPKEPEVFKTDTERGMERLRKQLEKPITLKDIQDYNRQEADPSKLKPVPSTPKLKSDADQMQPMQDRLGKDSETMSFKDFKDSMRTQEKPADEPKTDDTYRTDTEKNMERLRQQLNNPIKIDLSQFDRKKGRRK